MLVFTLLELLELGLVVGFVLALATQVIIPLLQGTPLFPFFHKGGHP